MELELDTQEVCRSCAFDLINRQNQKLNHKIIIVLLTITTSKNIITFA